MSCADDTGPGQMPALRTESEQVPSQTTPLTALLAQACHTVLDGHISAVGAGLASAAHTLLTCDDDGRPQPVAQTAAAGPARRTRHIALADLRGWPLYSVESARLTLHLTIPAPPGPDNVLHPAIPTSTATATMTATIRLSTRPGPPPLADELVAAALTPAPPTTDRTSAPARRAVAAFRHLPSLYRSIERLNTQAPGHRAATASVRAAQDLAAAVCTWCAGGPPVDPRLIAHAPHPENLDPNAPPALIALATAVSKLVHQIGHGSSTPES